ETKAGGRRRAEKGASPTPGSKEATPERRAGARLRQSRLAGAAKENGRGRYIAARPKGLPGQGPSMPVACYSIEPTAYSIEATGGRGDSSFSFCTSVRFSGTPITRTKCSARR